MIPDCECKHATQFVEGSDATLAVGAKDHFSICVRRKWFGVEFLAKLFEVVCFAVVCDPVAGVGVVHWLMAGGGSIDDSEARITDDDFTTRERPACDALVVRAAMSL